MVLKEKISLKKKYKYQYYSFVLIGQNLKKTINLLLSYNIKIFSYHKMVTLER